VQIDALEVVARDEVIQGGIRDEGQVVQLQDVEGFGGTRSDAKLSDPFIRYEFTVG